MIRRGSQEPGPRPLVRALVGLLAGLALGAVAALVIPRTRGGAEMSEASPPTS